MTVDGLTTLIELLGLACLVLGGALAVGYVYGLPAGMVTAGVLLLITSALVQLTGRKRAQT